MTMCADSGRLCAGTQSTLRSWLTAAAAVARGTAQGSAAASAGAAASAAAAQSCPRAACSAASAPAPQLRGAVSCPGGSAGDPQLASQPSEPSVSQAKGGSAAAPPGAARAGAQRGLKRCRPGQQPPRPNRAGSGQRSMRGFLTAPATPLPAGGGAAARGGPAPADVAAANGPAAEACEPGAEKPALAAAADLPQCLLPAAEAAVGDGGASISSSPNPSSNPSTNPSLPAMVGRAEAAAAWRSIRQKMKPPTCSGHGEACVIRQVKKAGLNKGVGFLSRLYCA